MKNYLSFIADAFVNTLKGLWVTLKILFLPATTVQYPTEKLVPYPRFRGMLAYDAGPIENSVVAEGLTAVLININIQFKIKNAGIQITGVPPEN